MSSDKDNDNPIGYQSVTLGQRKWSKAAISSCVAAIVSAPLGGVIAEHAASSNPDISTSVYLGLRASCAVIALGYAVFACVQIEKPSNRILRGAAFAYAGVGFALLSLICDLSAPM
jgi:hypothetical protein